MAVPLSPAEVQFHGLKTPRPSHLQEPSNRHATRAYSALRPWLGLAPLLVLAAIALFVYGQLFVFTDSYNNGLRVTINVWWGVPRDVAMATQGGATPKGPVIGHSELVRPTFVVLFGVVPVLVVALLVDWLRRYNVRRVTLSLLLVIARVLRRRPRVFGRLSYWSYGEWLFFVGIVLLGNVLVFYYGFIRRLKRARKDTRGLLHLDEYLELIGVTLGFNVIFNMAFLFLPATRNSAWLEFFNISYANAIKYHRWLGVVTVGLAVAHCGAFYWLWGRQGTWRQQALPCFDCDVGKPPGQGVWFNVFGELALVCFLLIALSSLPFIRRRFYNVFYYTHQLFVLAVVFAVMHWGPIVWWILPAFVLYLFSRALSMSNAFAPIEVNELTAISPSIVKLVLSRVSGHYHDHRVGQFLYLNVPAISKLQWHAFTIASSPIANPHDVTVLVKSLGDWTRELVAYANDCKQKNVLPTVYVDGFYGASLEMYDEYSTLCLVGGGIGVTPLFAILEDLTARLATHETIGQGLVFAFTFRELALLAEIVPALVRLRELDPQQRLVRLHLSLTETPTDDQLDQSLHHSNAQPRPTQYDTHSTLQRRALSPPLHSAAPLRMLTLVAVFFVAIAFVVYLEFGRAGAKFKRHGSHLWPLQQFVEIAAVIGSVLVVLSIAVFDRFAWLPSVAGSPSKDAAGIRDSIASVITTVPRLSNIGGPPQVLFRDWLQMHTYRDLIAEFGVRVGERLNVETLLQQVYSEHRSHPDDILGNGLVGLFVSGPGPLKRACEVAASRIDATAFDIHEEQFEL